MKRIFTVRHPQPVDRRNGMADSRTDRDLTEPGKEQADAAGKRPERSGAGSAGHMDPHPGPTWPGRGRKRHA